MALTDKPTLIDLTALNDYHTENKNYIAQKITERLAAQTKSYVVELSSAIIDKDNNSITIDTSTDTYNNIKKITTVSGDLTHSDVKIGDVIFLKELNVPDFWVSHIETGVGLFSLTKLETQKVDLNGFIDGTTIANTYLSKNDAQQIYATKNDLTNNYYDKEQSDNRYVQHAVTNAIKDRLDAVEGDVTALENISTATTAQIQGLFTSNS